MAHVGKSCVSKGARLVQFQQTLMRPAMCAGIGVHSGEKSKLVFHPADIGTGVQFIRTDIADKPNVVEAIGDTVSSVTLGTTLTNAHGVSVAVTEHLLAACAGIGLDNVVVEIDGPEVPIMDGSSTLFVELLLQAGLKQQAAPRRRIRILETVEVETGPKWAKLTPTSDDCLTMRVRIDFDNPAIGVQQMALRLMPGVFARDLAFARTFGFMKDAEKMRAMGLGLGSSLENAVVIEGETVINPEGLRTGDEFVRHKILDAIGDLMLAGGPIAGCYEANQPGHALNNALVRKLLETPQAWCWEVDEASGQAAAIHSSAQA